MAETKEIEAVEAENPEIIVEEPQKRVVAADEGIEGLKKQLEAEKSRREAAERQAQEAKAAVFQAKNEVDETNLQLVTNAIERMKSHATSLKVAYADAMAKGDYTRAADVQLEMADASVKLSQLETGRQAMAEKPKAAPPVSDPVEQMARGLDRQWPRSAAWIRAHPEYAKDPRLTKKMIAAHQMTEADDIPPDTDEYFEAVERHLGIHKPAAREEPEDDGTEMAAKVVARRSSPAAAPVSRSAPNSSGDKPRVIRLSADEREAARLSKMTDQEYWEQKQAIARDTRYN